MATGDLISRWKSALFAQGVSSVDGPKFHARSKQLWPPVLAFTSAFGCKAGIVLASQNVR
jgi:hypothetical protein